MARPTRRTNPRPHLDRPADSRGDVADSAHTAAPPAEAEERLRALARSAYDVFVELDAEYRILSASPNFAQQLGFEIAEARERGALELVHPDDRERAHEYLRQLHGERAVRGEPMRIRHADGNWRWIESSATVIAGGDGDDRILVVSRDLTESLQVAKALREREAYLRSLIHTANAVILMLSEDGLVLEWNREAEELYGVAKDSALGLDYVERFLPDGERNRVRIELLRLLGGGEATRDFEHVVRARGGHERILLWNAARVKAPDGGAAVLATGLDITGRRRAEEGLHESLVRTRAILDTALDGILSIDEESRIDTANPACARMFGYSVQDLVGQDVGMLMTPADAERHARQVARYLRTGERRILGLRREVVGLRKDGSTFPIDIAVSEVLLSGRRLFTAVLHDLSERKIVERARQQAEERARMAEELASIGTLAAGIAHDIGTPMNVILGYADLMEAGLPDEKNRGRARLIREQVHRITELIQTLLNVARPHDSVSLPVDLAETLDGSLGFFHERLRRRGIAVERDFAQIPSVQGDPDRLQQVFLNVFANAADAMPDGGTLAVSLGTRDAATVIVRVRDTGTGMPPEEMERVFEPFFTTKPRGRGTGLGLLVSRGIVADHGGSIEVSSELGEGTEIRILLPIDAAWLAEGI